MGKHIHLYSLGTCPTSYIWLKLALTFSWENLIYAPRHTQTAPWFLKPLPSLCIYYILAVPFLASSALWYFLSVYPDLTSGQLPNSWKHIMHECKYSYTFGCYFTITMALLLKFVCLSVWHCRICQRQNCRSALSRAFRRPLPQTFRHFCWSVYIWAFLSLPTLPSQSQTWGGKMTARLAPTATGVPNSDLQCQTWPARA